MDPLVGMALWPVVLLGIAGVVCGARAAARPLDDHEDEQDQFEAATRVIRRADRASPLSCRATVRDYRYGTSSPARVGHLRPLATRIPGAP